MTVTRTQLDALKGGDLFVFIDARAGLTGPYVFLGRTEYGWHEFMGASGQFCVTLFGDRDVRLLISIKECLG